MSILDYKIYEAMKKVKKKKGNRASIGEIECELLKIRINRNDVPIIVRTYAKNLKINWNNK